MAAASDPDAEPLTLTDVKDMETFPPEAMSVARGDQGPTKQRALFEASDNANKAGEAATSVVVGTEQQTLPCLLTFRSCRVQLHPVRL